MNREPASPAAVVAFLRGVERRAWLFLWLRDGDQEAAGPALAAALRAFARQAPDWPMADWPHRFWSLLAAAPAPAAAVGPWPGPLAPLGGFAAGPRQALLLRLVAGLDEEPAAAVLGLDLDGYRQALAAAVARDAGGEVDVAAWHALAQAVQQAARELPPRRLVEIASLREAALAGQEPAAARPRRQPQAAPPPARRRWPWVVAVLLTCALALLATAWLRPDGLGVGLGLGAEEAGAADDLRVHDAGPILVEELPPDPGAGGVQALPPAPLPEPDPLAARLDLLSWYAAGMPDSRIEYEGGEGPAAPALADAASALERIQAWQQLDLAGQAAVRHAAARFDALEPDAQAQLRARFARLDALEQRGWLLGPELGQDWPRLQLLLGYVEPAQRAPLLQSLRPLAPAQRQALAELGRRAGAEGRPALLQQWLALAPARRAQWLREQESR